VALDRGVVEELEGRPPPVRLGDRSPEARSRAAPRRLLALDPSGVPRAHPRPRHPRDPFRPPHALARPRPVRAIPPQRRLANLPRRKSEALPLNRRVWRPRPPHLTERRLRELLKADRSSGTHPRSRASLPRMEAVRLARRPASTTAGRPDRLEERVPIPPEDSARFRRSRLHPRPLISLLGVVRVARRSPCSPDLLRPPGPHRRHRGPQGSSIAPLARIGVAIQAEGRPCQRARFAFLHIPSIAERSLTAIEIQVAR